MAAQLTAAGDGNAKFWAAGAEGERRVAAVLDGLPPAWVCVHDRLLEPGLSQVNLDHIAIGPAGVFAVDAKMWAGTVDVWHQSLFRHKTGAGGAVTHECMDREVDKVRWLAQVMASVLGVMVIPVLCLASGRTGGLSEPVLVGGVIVVPVSKLAGWLTGKTSVLAVSQIINLAERCEVAFPATESAGLADFYAPSPRRSRELRRSRERVRDGRSRPTPSRPVARHRGPRQRRGTSPGLGLTGRLILAIVLIPVIVQLVAAVLANGR